MQLKCKNNTVSKPQFNSIWPIDRTFIRCYHSGPEWTWEWWQWMGTLHSPKLSHYWNLIRLFSVIIRTLIGGWRLTPLQRSSRYILQSLLTEQKCSFVTYPRHSSPGIQSVYSKPAWQSFLSNTNNFFTAIWFKVFQPNTNNHMGSPSGVMANVSDCSIEVSEFKLQFTFRLLIFGKAWTLLSLGYRLNGITAVLLKGWLWH